MVGEGRRGQEMKERRVKLGEGIRGEGEAGSGTGSWTRG
jgi:hypothetical protein